MFWISGKFNINPTFFIALSVVSNVSLQFHCLLFTDTTVNREL